MNLRGRPAAPDGRGVGEQCVTHEERCTLQHTRDVILTGWSLVNSRFRKLFVVPGGGVSPMAHAGSSAAAANDSRRIPMSHPKKNRFYTGVSLEPQVSEYLDDLARRMGMSRSWVLNTIVYEYARLMEKKQLVPARRIQSPASSFDDAKS